MIRAIKPGAFSAAVTSRRFPTPWTAEEQPACFVVRDHNGQALAYVYYEDEPSSLPELSPG